MLMYLKGDMFNSPAQVLVNTVNTVGVMGKGVALEFKNRYPDMFNEYQRICEEKKLDVGQLFLWKKSDKWVLLFPTKVHWRNPSKIEYIECGLRKFVDNYSKLGIESIAFPRLGCGNGGLEWDIVRPLMERYLISLPIRIYIYVGDYSESTPEHRQITEMEKWIRNNPTNIGFNSLRQDLIEACKANDKLLLGNTIKHVRWETGKFVIQNGHEIAIAEDELCSFWHYIRDVGIVSYEKLPEQFKEYGIAMLCILSKLDYLQPVIISSNGIDFEKKSNGYQYIRE